MENPSSINGAVLLSPGPFTKREQLDACPELKQPGDIFTRKGLVLNKAFFERIQDIDWLERICLLPFPALVIACEDDRWCLPHELRKLSDQELEIVIFPTGGHNFLDYDSRTATLQMITEFLKRRCNA